VKLGVSGEAARLMAESGGETPSASLIGDGFGTVHTNVPMRTPRTVSSGDVLKQQARNLRAMTESQTPLLGGDIYIEGNVGFESTTPNILSKIPKATPNPLLSNLTPSLASGSTPFGMTPLRDNMSINTPAIHSVHGFDETPRSVKGNAIQSRLHLQSMFKSLPKAKNDFEIVIPEIEEDDTVESTETIQPDSDDVKAALNLQKEKKKKEEFLRMSLVVQRNLPRPVVTQELFEMLTNDPGSTVESLINMQVGLLVYEDCVRFPIDGQQSIVNSLNSFEILDDVYLHEADTLIKNETTNIPEIEIESKSFDSLFEYIPATCTKSASFLEIGKLAKDHRTQTLLYSAQFSKLEQEMKSLAGKCSKLEKKQNILFGKHYTISTSLRARIFEMGSILEAGVTELEELKLVYENEISIVELRIGDVSKWLEKLSLLEQDLQDEYRRLSNNDHAI
jgi:pre-mRNA-splicing factor CDC5/CEF1